jgi:peptidoglycan/LPS O-acetylase OafA/YrhL
VRFAHVAALDGVRALAVSSVVAFHLGMTWAPGGYLGVDVFFVLSGFLITALLLSERGTNGRISLGRFYARRALRLLPALLAVLGALWLFTTVTVVGDSAHRVRGDGLAALFYFANWRAAFGHAPFLGFMGHAWSLSIEEQFYAVWPLLVVGALALRGGRRSLVLVLAVAGTVVPPLLRLAWWDGSAATMTRLYYGLDTRADALFAGAVLAVIVASGRLPVGRLARSVYAALALGALAVLGLLVATMPRSDASLYRGAMSLVAVSAVALIAHLLASPRGPLGRVLSVPPLAALGKISYGVYLWHWPVIVATNPWGRTGGALVAKAAIALGLSIVSWWVVERPFLRLKDRFRSSVPVPAVAPERRARASRRTVPPRPAGPLAPSPVPLRLRG